MEEKCNLPENFMDSMKKIVYQAGDMIKETGDIASGITAKEGAANFVTKYDSMVQRFLIEKLSILLPEANYMGEEDGQVCDVNNGYVFIIDPIDGTTNFIMQFMCSGISVGLAKDGDLIAGIVYNPFRDEMFYAEKGKGAFLNGKQFTMEDRTLQEGITIFGSIPYYPYLRDAGYALEKEISYKTMDMRDIGSSALGVCYAACGRSVIFASPLLCTWDYAAGAVIVEEAGGVCKHFDGSELKLRNKLPAVFGTPKAVAEFVEASKKYADQFVLRA